MQFKSLTVISLLMLALCACGKKPAEAPPPESAPVAAPAPATAPEPVAGGYEPTADERVPGITRTKEEQDKMNAEALAGTPLPVIPGEAAPATKESMPEQSTPEESAPEAK